MRKRKQKIDLVALFIETFTQWASSEHPDWDSQRIMAEVTSFRDFLHAGDDPNIEYVGNGEWGTPV